MFKNEYQGGPTVDILSAQGKDPLNKWKISGNPSSLKRQYDKDVKSNVYSFDGSTTTCKMQLPRDGARQTLGLTQRFLTIQIFVQKDKDFAVELIMTDKGNSKRRLVISTTVRENYTTPLHAKLNLGLICRQTWLNLCFDLFSFIEDTFPRQSFKSLDSISLSGTCKVRRIFTMRNQPPDTTDMADTNINYSQLENIPPAMQFSSTIQYLTQVITVAKIRSYLRPNTSTQIDLKDQSGYCSSSSDDQNKPRLTAREQGQTVIAFGSTIRVDKNKLSTSGRDRKDSSSSYISGVSSTSTSLISKSGRKIRRPTSARKIGSARDKTPPVSTQTHPSVINIDTQSTFTDANESGDAANNNDHMFKKPTIPTSSRSQKSLNAEKRLINVDIPISLVDLVDELSDNDSDNNRDFSSPFSVSESEVFMFSSRPHSATSQKRTESESSSIPDLKRHNVAMEKDFEKSDSSDSEDEIRKRIFENTPSPRLISSPEQLKNKFTLPLHSSSIASPRETSVYDSQKYKSTPPAKSLQPEARKSVLPPHRALNRSVVSLRSSDATITASVETLKQKSVEISVTHDDSLESEKSVVDNSPLNKFNDSSAIDQNYLHVTTSPRRPDNTSQRSVTVARKSLRELPISPPSHNSPRVLPPVPEFKGYKVSDLSDSMEAAMLASLKREQDAEMHENDTSHTENMSHTQHKYDINMDESFDTSWSTWKQPPEMHSSAYKDEMEGSSPVPKITDTLLGLSLGKHDVWGNLSPPVVMPIDRERQEKESISDIESMGDVFGLSDGSTVSGKSGSTSTGLSDEEEMLDLMFDPCLNCYFDPRTQRYYELKG